MLSLAFGIVLAGCSSPATSAPVVVTVIHTVPVEATRLVEITQLVEVTRQVVVTQIVEVPVTLTHAEPAGTPTPLPVYPAFTPASTFALGATPPVTPQVKGNGFAPFFIRNDTNEKLDFYLYGQISLSLSLWPDDVQQVWLSEGDYTYIVWRDGIMAYDGSLHVTNIDKQELILHETKLVFRIP